MDKFLKCALKGRKITLFFATLLIALGFYCYKIIPEQENPDVSANVARVVTIYPGGSPEDVQNLVTKKIEDAAANIEGFDYIKSYSKNNVSIILVFLKTDANSEQSWQQLRNEINDIPDLPEQCFDSEIETDLVSTAGMIISLSGDNYSYDQLDSYAEEMKNELSKIDGVSKFDIDGKLDKQVKIDIDVDKLNQYPISLADVVTVLKAQNLNIPSGAIDTKEQKINVLTNKGYNSLKDIENTVIYLSQESGALVRLRDIANIHMDYQDDEVKFKQNGKNAILLTGFFEDNKNIVLIGKDIKQKLNELKSNLPKDIKVNEVLYQPQAVDDSVSSFMNNLIQGILLVIIVIFAGVGLRNSIVVSTALPISILLTFIIMYITKIKIHQISTTALIIALGILVDNAIVISDAIQTKIDNGMDNFTAAFKGTKESSIPIFTSTLTTIAAFAPLLTIPGAPGMFLESIPMVVIISLFSSYLCALFITPALASLSFKKNAKNKKKKSSKLRTFFNNLLKKALKYKKNTILISILALILTFVLITQLNLQFFPYADKNMMYINTVSEKTGDLNETEKIAKNLENILKKQPEITNYTTGLGDGLPKFYITMPPPIPANENSQTKIDFDLSKSKRFKNNEQFANYLQKTLDANLVGAKSHVYPLEYAMPSEAPITMRISGDNLKDIYDASKKIQQAARKIPGTCNIRDSAAESTYQYKVNLDLEKASQFAISKYDVESQINIALRGTEASVYRKSGKEFNIIVNSTIDSKQKLENLAIKSTLGGNKILLKEIATITLEPQIDTIMRYNKKMYVETYVDVIPGVNAIDVQNVLEKKLQNMKLDKVDIQFDGEKEDIKEYFGKITIAALFAIFVIYIILLIQFNSFIQPFIILLTIPLSLIGSITGLFLFRQPLSLMAFMGIVSLVGIVVKNAILLIEYINKARNNGFSLDESCIDAMDKRFSPIILSAITTVMGLVPIVFSNNPMFVPMAVSLMCGLIVSTLLTLIIIPVLYNLIENFTIKIKKKMKGKLNNKIKFSNKGTPLQR